MQSLHGCEPRSGVEPTGVQAHYLPASGRPEHQTARDHNRYYIHPEQVTVASVAILGLGRQPAEQLAASLQCAVTVSWDAGAGSQDLSAGEPY